MRVFKTRVVVDGRPVVALIATTKYRLSEVAFNIRESLEFGLSTIYVEKPLLLNLEEAVLEEELEVARSRLFVEEEFQTLKIDY